VPGFYGAAHGHADAAVTAVLECREQIGALNQSRITHELVAPYFGPAD
jgi:hypothetical protein